MLFDDYADCKKERNWLDHSGLANSLLPIIILTTISTLELAPSGEAAETYSRGLI
jgi:hypothetical protein